MASHYIEIIGGISGSLTTISFFPQAQRVYKTNDTESISLVMFIILNVGLCGWIYYGFLLHQVPVIVPNVVTCILALYILIKKISAVKRGGAV